MGKKSARSRGRKRPNNEPSTNGTNDRGVEKEDIQISFSEILNLPFLQTSRCGMKPARADQRRSQFHAIRRVERDDGNRGAAALRLAEVLGVASQYRGRSRAARSPQQGARDDRSVARLGP